MQDAEHESDPMQALSNGPATRAVQVHSNRPLLVADVIRIEAEQRELLGQYVTQQMVENTDFGVIPGTNRKALLKPGAEKLCSLFRCTPRFEIVEKVEDWNAPFFYYQFRAFIESNESGAVVAEGFGSANSRESKWRWRKADRACPKCGKTTIRRSKFPPRDNPEAEPGWYCYGKDGGCGANFDAADPSITSQVQGKIENPDICNEVNTILKMAKKRALVDASIALARCSDLFTQDVEDDDRPQQPAKKQSPPAQTPHDPISVDELNILFGVAKLQWESVRVAFGEAVDRDYSDMGLDDLDQPQRLRLKQKLNATIEKNRKGKPPSAGIPGDPDSDPYASGEISGQASEERKRLAATK